MARTEQTIYLDDLSDHLQLTDEGASASWPRDAEIVLDVRWHPAEPDVGIMSEYGEIDGVTYYLDRNTKFTDEDEFVAALYAVIGEWCEEGPDAIKSMVANRIENEELDA